MNALVHKVAEYITNLEFGAISVETIDMAKKCILDSVGNMISGRYSAMGDLALIYTQAYGRCDSSVEPVYTFGGDQILKEDALTRHAIMARCSDLDDGHRFAMGHPGSVIIPTALTIGEFEKCDNKTILTAIVVGYDVYCRIGEAINPSSYRERGFDSTGVSGTVACAAVIAKLKCFDVKRTRNALGIAATFASGLIEYQNDGSMGKVLCGHFAIRNALQAIQLADVGFTGPEKIFEGPKGFFQAFSNTPKEKYFLKGLGKQFKINETYFKIHACMRGLHAAVDAIIELKLLKGIDEHNIETIEIRTSPFVARLSKPKPKTSIAAQCSLEFVVAVALSLGEINEEKVLTEALQDPKYFELTDRIKLILDDSVDAYVKQNPSHWAAVNVVALMKDGNRYEQWTPLPKGEQEMPFNWDTLSVKFDHLIDKTPYKQYSEALVNAIKFFDESDIIWTGLYAPWHA